MSNKNKIACEINLKTLNQALQEKLIEASKLEKTTKNPELPKKNMSPKKDGRGK